MLILDGQYNSDTLLQHVQTLGLERERSVQYHSQFPEDFRNVAPEVIFSPDTFHSFRELQGIIIEKILSMDPSELTEPVKEAAYELSNYARLGMAHTYEYQLNLNTVREPSVRSNIASGRQISP